MNSVLLDNKIKLESIINNNDKLKDIIIKDDKLEYKNDSVDLNKLNLNTLLSDNYSKLVHDIRYHAIYPENFFEILKINTYIIEEDTLSLTNYALSILDSSYDIISFNHFKRLLNSNILEEKDYNDITNFYKYMRLLLLQTSSDDTYLNDKQKNLLDNYIDLMQEMLQNNQHNNASDNYLKMIDDVNQEKTKRLNKKLSLEKKDGFVNALLIIFVMVVTGFVIGCCTFFIK